MEKQCLVASVIIFALCIPVLASALDTSKPRFDIVWLEPHSINTSVTSRAGQLTSADLRSIVDNYHTLGVGTLVVAYTEYLGCFIYKPAQSFSFYSYGTGATLSSSDPSKQCKLLSDGDFLTVLLDQASKDGIKVIIGLSNGEDQYLLNDIDSNLRVGSTQYVSQTPGHTLNDRLSQATNVAASISKDLNAQYGSSPAFAGWYLPFETDCLDVGTNYYKPVADALKKLTPGKLVMISPTADTKVCYNAQSYADAVTALKGLVDIYAYQDAIGSGYRRINGYGQNFFTDAARDLRRAEITPVLQSLKAVHDQTATQFWINTEVWRMDGSCGYGCSFPGDWASVQKQLDAWSVIARNNLMLNEGFLQFDFGITNAKLSNAVNQKKAADFTAAYQQYLDGTIPAQSPVQSPTSAPAEQPTNPGCIIGCDTPPPPAGLPVGIPVVSAPNIPTQPQPTSPTSSCFTASRTISRGMRGSDISSLQSFLISQNLLSSDSATGYFGVLTENAVKQFQKMHNIAHSGTAASTGYGVVGPRTRVAINQSCTAAHQSGVTPTAQTLTTNPFIAAPSSGDAPLTVSFSTTYSYPQQYAGADMLSIDFGDGTGGGSYTRIVDCCREHYET